MKPRPTTTPPPEPFIERDFSSWRLARHVARVAEQRRRRIEKPAPRKRPTFKCKVCDRTPRSRLQLQEHEQGVKHQRALARKKTQEEPLECKLCDVKFDRESNYTGHFHSRQHREARRRCAEAEE